MAATPPRDVTCLPLAWRDDDGVALQSLVPLVSSVLHRLARPDMRREPHRYTLQTTALIHVSVAKLRLHRDLSRALAAALTPR